VFTTVKAGLEQRPDLNAIDPLISRGSERARLIENALEEQSLWTIGSEDGILGYGILKHDFFGYGFIRLLYIGNEFRRKGLGSQLLQHMESICTTSKLFTSTNESNKPAQLLLKNLGYAQSGVIHNLDPGDPEIVYFKQVR